MGTTRILLTRESENVKIWSNTRHDLAAQHLL